MPFLIKRSKYVEYIRKVEETTICRNTTIKYSHMIKGDKRRDLELS